MSRFLKITAILLALLVAIALVLPFIIPVEKLKDPLLAQIESATGRKVSIGKIKLSVFPTLALDAEEVTFGNPDWAKGNMASMDKLRLGVELLPLLHNEVHLTEITLEKPVITLIQQEGRANWQLQSNKPATSTPQRGAQPAGAPAGFYLSQLSIKDGTVTLDSSGFVTTVTDINVTFSGASGDKVVLDGAASYNGQKVSLALTLDKAMDALSGSPADGTLKASIGALDLSWKGTFALKDGRPILTGTLAVAEIDTGALPAAAEKAAGQAPAVASSEKSGHWSDTPIDLSGLARADGDLSLALGKLKLKQATFSDIKAHVQLAQGTLHITTDEISAYSGKIRMVLAANSAGISTSASASGIALGPLLKDFAGSDKLSGTLSGQCALTAQGASERAMVGTLSGNGSFEIRDGAFRGVDLNAMMHNIVSAFENHSASTSFSRVSGSFTAKNGVISNSDLALESSGLKASGAGTANLPGWQVNYLLKPVIVVASVAKIGPGVAVPLRIDGPLDNPSYRPDFKAALQENLKDPAALKENLKQLKQNLLGSGSLGGLLGR